jgi:hypothetical protein
MTDILTEKLDLILLALENGPRLTIEEPMSSVISSEVVALFGGVIVGFLTIALSYYAYLAQRNISVSTIKKRVNSEIYEVIRHLSTNLDLLNRVKDSDKKLAYFHFEKMKINKISIFFDEEAIKHYPLRLDAQLRQITLFLRNNDIELDYIIDRLKNANIDKSEYDQLVNYYMLKTKLVIGNLHSLCCYIWNANNKSDVKKCKKCVFKDFNKILDKERDVKGQKDMVVKLDLVFENGVCLKKQKNNKGKLVDGIDEYIYCE